MTSEEMLQCLLQASSWCCGLVVNTLRRFSLRKLCNQLQTCSPNDAFPWRRGRGHIFTFYNLRLCFQSLSLFKSFSECPAAASDLFCFHHSDQTRSGTVRTSPLWSLSLCGLVSAAVQPLPSAQRGEEMIKMSILSLVSSS